MFGSTSGEKCYRGAQRVQHKNMTELGWLLGLTVIHNYVRGKEYGGILTFEPLKRKSRAYDIQN